MKWDFWRNDRELPPRESDTHPNPSEPFEGAPIEAGPEHPLYEQHLAITAWVATWRVLLPLNKHSVWRDLDTGCGATAASKAVRSVEGPERLRMALALVERGRVMPRDRGSALVIRNKALFALNGLADALLAKPGPVSADDFHLLFDEWRLHPILGGPIRLELVLTIAKEIVVREGSIQSIEGPLRLLEREIRERVLVRREYLFEATLHRITALTSPEVSYNFIQVGWQEPFRDATFGNLLNHARKATSSNRPEKWAKEARTILKDLGERRFLDAFREVVAELRKMKQQVETDHSDLLRGLAWFAGLVKEEDVAASLGEFAMACAQKMSSGYCSVKGFNGAIVALEHIGTFEALAELSKIKNRAKGIKMAQAATDALVRAAERQGIAIAELEELVVPVFGLDMPGVLSEELGTTEARLEVVGSTDAVLRWFRNGKELKSPPAEVKREYAEPLKELRQTVKEIEQSLSGQKARIEGLMFSGRTLPYRLWRERYLDHPLLANMTRRLIWQFGDRAGIAPNGQIVDGEGQSIEPEDDCPVKLWHPIGSSVATVGAWRAFLVDRQISQPFKQAYREIYILTDAERHTNTYSNRFAAHVLKQHQMASLMRQRGWRFSQYGFWDTSGSTPTLSLPQWSLKAEFFVDPGSSLNESDDTTEAGIFFYVASDQVRFLGVDGQPVPLADVPPLVFSEVMRDVDLFVGVASVGNDPEWQDTGARLGLRDYWRNFAFGELATSALTRADVLARLLPRMKIGEVAELRERFLVVKGSLRTYKIHLGSGNILMEPNDQYLCIVPSSGDHDKLYLPFEGDRKLAEILSKAILLADDAKIQDVTITRQIKG